MADVNTTPPLYGDPAEFSADERVAELEQARRLAERYRLEFVDMDTFRIDQELFRSIPADLMLRYGFVPYRREGRSLCIVVSEETGTISLARQGRLERPITSSRLHDLLSQALALPGGRSVAKDPPERRG